MRGLEAYIRKLNKLNGFYINLTFISFWNSFRSARIILSITDKNAYSKCHEL